MEALMQQGGGAAPPPIDDGKMIELTQNFLDKDGSYARNESSSYPMTNLFIGDSRLGCQSDADEQLILHVSFTETVKVHSFKFTEFNNGADPDLNPTSIKLYVNRENLGFEDCNDIDPTQEFDLCAADLKELADPLSLKFVKFQRVRSITIFVEDNAGGNVTALGSLKMYGKPMAGTNMAEFKKVG